MVIHGAIDRFSRLVVMLNCSPNNKAETVMQQFLQAILSYRTPLRIRTDHGTENVKVATIEEINYLDKCEKRRCV